MKKIIIIILFLFKSAISNACDCNKTIGLNEAENVFEGTVLSIVRIDSLIVRYEIIFAIEKNLKGKIHSKKIKINTPCLLEMCCGITFKENEKYLVYTFVRNGMLYTNTCTNTKKI